MDNFEKYNNIAAYKNTQEKINSNPNLATYEEVLNSENHVKIQNVWMDSQFIPDSAPNDQIDGDGFYRVQFFSDNIPIIRKVVELRLSLEDGTRATFYNSLLLNAIPFDYGDGYQYELKDTAGNIVPFGLNNWVVDGNSGTLSFLGGLPTGFSNEFIITFWRYCGRTGPDRILFNDGTTKMVNGYVPVYNKSIADKEYVDKNIAELDKKIGVITPIAPDTFENFDLSVSSSKEQLAHYIETDEERKITYYNDDIKVDVPVFYNQEVGIVSLMINNIAIDSIDLSSQSITNGSILGNLNTFHIEKAGYLDNIMVYKKIKMYCVIRYNTLPFDVTDKNRLSIQLRYANGQSYFYSKEALYGFEDPNVLDSSRYGLFSNTRISDLISDNNYISGVPAITSGETIKVLSRSSLLYSYKTGNQKEIVCSFTKLDVSTTVFPSVTYSEKRPEKDFEYVLTIPQNKYSETLDFSLVSSKLDGSGNHTEHLYSYPIRIDSKSDESLRVTSGEGDYPISFGNVFNPSDSLVNSSELQLINGSYRWPSGDYTSIGKFVNQSIVNVTQNEGPNYNLISKIGTRWVTLKYVIPVCNGVFIDFKNLVNASEDIDTHVLSRMKVFIKILNGSGWLNANSPYDGVSIPRSDGSACLLSGSSTLSEKKITFGRKAIGGTMLVRIGIIDNPSITFDGIEIRVTT